jgi:hypothetical protein
VTVHLSAPANLEAIPNEAAFQTLVKGALLLMGWVVIDLKDVRADERGIPDLLCFRAGRGEMIELKLIGRDFSPNQKRWQQRHLPESTPVYLFRNTHDDWLRLMVLMG